MDRNKWEYKKLTDVCSILYGYPFDSKCFNETNQGRPLIRIRDVVRGYTETYTTEDCPDDYIINEGDYLVGMDGEFNISAWKSAPALLNQRVCKISADGANLIDGFMYYLMKTKLKEIEGETAFVTVKHLSAKVLNKVNVHLPSISDQQRIVAELDCLNEMIAVKQEQLKEFDKLAQSIFYDMFGDPINNEKQFPKLTIDDVIKFEGGSQPARSYFEYEPTPDNIRLIQIRDYKTDAYITYIPKKMARRFCEEDDIMIGRYGPPIFQILRGLKGAYNVALMKAVPKKGNKEFIRAFLKQECLLHYLENFSRRVAGQDGIQMDELKAYPFPYPPLSLQQQFADKISAIEAQKELVKQSIAETQHLLDYTMDKYFG